MDLSEEEEDTLDLLNRLGEFNLAQIRHFLKADVDMIRIPEDLGMQNGPMLSPAMFWEYIKPIYQRMLEPVRQARSSVCIPMAIYAPWWMISLMAAWM